MAQTIKLKRSSVQNKVPTTTDVELGEIAINTYDGKLFIKKDSGTASIIQLGNVKSDEIEYIKKLTQAEYDSLTPSADTLYIITDAENIKLEELQDANISSIQDGQLLIWDNANTEWVNSNLVIDNLDDVDTTTTAPTNGQVLKWDGTNWAPDNESGTTYTAGTGLSLTGTTFALDSGIDNLDDVDTTTTAPSVDDYLTWDGTNWTPQSPETISINDLDDVDTATTAPVLDDYLAWDGANWSTKTPSTVSLNDLDDVTTTGQVSGNIIQYDGTSWGLATIPSQKMLQDTDFDATAGQTAFVVTNKVFSKAFVTTNGSKDRANTYSISDNGTDTTITFSTGKNLNDWVSVEYEA
jgi:hypothetical protein